MSTWYKPWTWETKNGLASKLEHSVDESQSTIDQRNNLNNQGGMASVFGDQGQDNYNAMTAEAAQQRAMLQKYASGQDSQSAEQLRQGLGSQLSAQRSMAASASPQNAAMSARTAMMNMGRASAGMSGNAAMAGIAERKAATDALIASTMQQRQQDANVALGSRQNAISGYGGVKTEGSTLDKFMPIVNAAGGAAAAGFKFSDRTMKTEIKDGDKDANKALRSLQAYTYKYKDEKHGAGKQFGPMAQDMEKAGLGHAVVNTSKGKMVDGAAAALSSLGLVAALSKRVAKIEGK